MTHVRSAHRESNAGRITAITGVIEPLADAGLIAALRAEQGIAVLATRLSASALEQAVVRERPNVAIVGENLQHSLLSRLRSTHPSVGLVVIALEPSWVLGTHLLSIGTTCIDRATPLADLIHAIRLAACGEPRLVSANGQALAPQHLPDGRLFRRREIQVLELLCRDQSNKEIAASLNVGVETARKYVSEGLAKLGVKNRKDLIHKVIISPSAGMGRQLE
jgi:DNA-binding NarL/FixJ family response regulator